jgi:hypothetical protein
MFMFVGWWVRSVTFPFRLQNAYNFDPDGKNMVAYLKFLVRHSIGET